MQKAEIFAKVKEMAKDYDITVIVAQEPGEAARLRRELENSRVRKA